MNVLGFGARDSGGGWGDSFAGREGYGYGDGAVDFLLDGEEWMPIAALSTDQAYLQWLGVVAIKAQGVLIHSLVRVLW